MRVIFDFLIVKSAFDNECINNHFHFKQTVSRDFGDLSMILSYSSSVPTTTASYSFFISFHTAEFQGIDICFLYHSIDL
jgi:hypothetical protein